MPPSLMILMNTKNVKHGMIESMHMRFAVYNIPRSLLMPGSP